MILTFLQQKHCFTRVMGPKHTENSVDPDQAPPRRLSRKKAISVIKNKYFIVKSLLFSKTLFYSHKI